MQFQVVNFVSSLLLISLGTTIGCAKLLEDQSELERVEATFFYDPTSASVLGAYSVKLPEERLTRRIIVHSLDPIRNTDIYVRTGEHSGFIQNKLRAGSKVLRPLIFELRAMRFELFLKLSRFVSLKILKSLPCPIQIDTAIHR